MHWRLQGQRREIIEDFKTIIKKQLEQYKKKNGVLPEKILYYRDGVSEGQFNQVLATERMDIVQACHEMNGGAIPLTIVVVQKRHNTRFFPGTTNVGKGDRNNNAPPGTIVDTIITRPKENYFYLISHKSIQGVARPTKYCILLDEGDHNINDLQELTYYVSLCCVMKEFNSFSKHFK